MDMVKVNKERPYMLKAKLHWNVKSGTEARQVMIGRSSRHLFSGDSLSHSPPFNVTSRCSPTVPHGHHWYAGSLRSWLL